VEVDFALVQRQKQAVFFNERKGWEDYFQEHLRDTTVARRNILQDGSNNNTQTTMIHYHQLVWDKFFRYRKDNYYNAVISATCDGVDSFNYRKWLSASPTNYCVFHAATTRHISKYLNRSCWLTPMMHQHAPDNDDQNNCFFLPVDLPKFQPTTEQPKRSSSFVNICAFGKSHDRHHGLLAEAFATLAPSTHIDDVGITIYARSNQNQKQTTIARNKDVRSVYQHWNVSKYVTLVANENKFVEFQKSIATQCHLLLPLIDPVLHPDYFPRHDGGVNGRSVSSKQRLTGTIIQIIANAIPAVIHADLERIYHDYLLRALPLGDIGVYNTTGSFIQSLDQMVRRIRRKRSRRLAS
jgi:hypothetical protein